ncbi:uncharacterized protein RCC_04957 [Ramularia collo-cygni]|uniref:Altered inheritance of mitochondria protein 6 n=1 Tax=Ramularia collo-cygni TaxID=112498 RepID=A0A2D3USA8_9PEZI|nr:uncharacterized protein RCC_04957 [Ramularia collo-cygni]CZT19111.1 uncharacterized protein RCC_04957 [Ramularia collo-cygni]
MKTLLILPVVLLSIFGLLHILQVLIGSARVFWDLNDDDQFLPNWGKSGHAGEGLVDYPTDATRDVRPINCHSHNDYVRRVPLFDAIHWGCTGVEADVWSFGDEELYVGHSTASLTKKRTFRNLYVDPIVKLLDNMNLETGFANVTVNTTQRGIFEEDPSQTLVLLVDFKTSGSDTFPLVHKQLEALREKDYLSYFDGTQLHSRPVTVVGTGNTPFDLIVAEKQRRDIFFDAPLERMWEAPSELEGSSAFQQEAILFSNQKSNQGSVGTQDTAIDDFNSTNSYYASVSFAHSIGFVWRGRLSAKQMSKIRGQIQGAQRRGLKTRYWDTPSWPINLRNHVWDVLMKEGADMLNVDDLKGAAAENWKIRTHRFWS